MIIPDWFFKEEKTPIRKKIQKIYNPKTLKQLAREKIKLDDKEVAKIMINPYYFIDENLKIGFKINLESHNFSHANFILTITPKFPEFGIEFRYINKIVKESSVIYARLINQYKFKCHSLFSASFYKINEEDQRKNEIELYINLKINHNLTESDIDNIDFRSQLEQQIQIQETKESGWIFDKINSMKISFYKTTELNGTSYVKIPLRSNAILYTQKNDKYCFIWSILASLHPCENDHPNRVNNYVQYFKELNFQNFDFTNGFKCSDVHKFNEINNLSVNIYELNFYQDGDKWKHNLLPTEISKNVSDNVIDLLIYKNHYVLIKKLHVFLGDHNKSFVCRRCLNSYTCLKDSNFIPFAFHNFSNYDCHMFLKRLIDFKKAKVKFKIIPETNEENIIVKYGCIRFIDSYRFLSEKLEKLVKNLDEYEFKILKKEFPDKWQYLNKKLAYPYQYFNSIDEYKKPVDNLKKEDFFSKLKKQMSR